MLQNPVARPTAPGRNAVIVGVAITLTLAVLGGSIHHAGTSAGERTVTGPWGSIAFGAVIATPALLAALGLQRRPWLLAAAGLLLLPMCILSFSCLFFPLLIPGGIFIARATTQPRPDPIRHGQVAAAIVSGLFVIAALLSLFHQSPIAWSTAAESGDASDAITSQEALVAFVFLAAAIATACITPRDGQST